MDAKQQENVLGNSVYRPQSGTDEPVCSYHPSAPMGTLCWCKGKATSSQAYKSLVVKCLLVPNPSPTTPLPTAQNVIDYGKSATVQPDGTWNCPGFGAAIWHSPDPKGNNLFASIALFFDQTGKEVDRSFVTPYHFTGVYVATCP